MRLTRQAVEATSPMTHSDVRARKSAACAPAMRWSSAAWKAVWNGFRRKPHPTALPDRAESAANDLRKEVLARDQALAEAATRENGLRRDIQEREEAVAMAIRRQRELERSPQAHDGSSAGDGATGSRPC
ncbi:MAG: hypothetical protein HPM95_05540 [Alphaproteobacteria bacterium]|nr:hypothetical protein [Alphaproteobacteria bacterium]